MNKPFSNLIKKDKNTSLSKNVSEQEGREKSKPLIILGVVLSLSSIFLLLYTIKIKFG